MAWLILQRSYRITTNGKKFRVECAKTLWGIRFRWEALSVEWDTVQEAQGRVAFEQENDRLKTRPAWWPVETYNGD